MIEIMHIGVELTAGKPVLSSVGATGIDRETPFLEKVPGYRHLLTREANYQWNDDNIK